MEQTPLWDVRRQMELWGFRKLGVCEQLAEACEKIGWLVPTQIQYEALRCVRATQGRRDIIGEGRKGCGKTGALFIIILQVFQHRPQPFFACILSPTRESATQIADLFAALGSGFGITCAGLVEKFEFKDQEKALEMQPHIVVATPGCLLDHLNDTKGFRLQNLKYLVFDDSDMLVNANLVNEIEKILNILPRERKTYLFSATMTREVDKLQRACLRNPVKVEASLAELYKYVDAKDKNGYLFYILNEFNNQVKSMVFTRTVEEARHLCMLSSSLGMKAISLDCEMEPAAQAEALNEFESGKCGICFSTDLGGKNFTLPLGAVINYDIPIDFKDYIHRVGRTVLSLRDGYAISLVNQYEVESYRSMERCLGRNFSELYSVTGNVVMVCERVKRAERKAKKLR